MTIMLRKDEQRQKLTCRKSGVKDRSDVSHRFNIFHKFLPAMRKASVHSIHRNPGEYTHTWKSDGCFNRGMLLYTA